MTAYNPAIETFRTAIFDIIPTPLLVLDSNLYVLTGNQGFYEHFKVTPDETVSRSVFEIGEKEWGIPELKRLLENVLPDRTTIRNFEVVQNFPRIGNRSFLVNARQIKSNSFLPLEIILIAFEDTTERKRVDTILDLNKKLEMNNRKLENFGHSLTHDLNAPLAIILNLSKIILDDYSSELPESVKDDLNRILHSAETLEKMMAALYQLSGLSRSPVQRKSVNLSELAYNVISQLKLNEPDRIVDVTIRPNMIENVESSMFLVLITNLLKNSWKFTRNQSQGRIIFDFLEENGKKTFFVKDNGVGFNMKYAPKLFGMFQRLHSNKDFEGTGTGLAIVKEIINMHNGEVWAESEEGKGTTIFFTIGQ